jgi:hypothetical protein
VILPKSEKKIERMEGNILGELDFCVRYMAEGPTNAILPES